MTEFARLLRGTPIFGAIREDVIDFLLSRGRKVELARGEWLLREGDASGSMYIIERGEVVILKQHEGRQYLISTLARGDCIGEMALIDLMPRSASALAVLDAAFLEITAASLLALYERDLEQFALVQMNMGREVSRRLRRCEERIFHNESFAEFDVEHCVPRDTRDGLPAARPLAGFSL